MLVKWTPATYMSKTQNINLPEVGIDVLDIVHLPLRACTFQLSPSGQIMSFPGQDDPFLQAQA